MDYITGDVSDNVRRRLFVGKKGLAYVFSFRERVPEFLTYEVPRVVAAKPDGLYFENGSGDHWIVPWTEIKKWTILYPDGGDALAQVRAKLSALGYSLRPSQ